MTFSKRSIELALDFGIIATLVGATIVAIIQKNPFAVFIAAGVAGWIFETSNNSNQKK